MCLQLREALRAGLAPAGGLPRQNQNRVAPQIWLPLCVQENRADLGALGPWLLAAVSKCESWESTDVFCVVLWALLGTQRRLPACPLHWLPSTHSLDLSNVTDFLLERYLLSNWLWDFEASFSDSLFNASQRVKTSVIPTLVHLTNTH